MHNCLPVTDTRLRAKLPLQRLHADLMGPFSEVSFGGSSYLLTMKDEASDFAWVVALKRKGQAAGEIVVIFRQLFNSMGKYPSELLTNQGTEFLGELTKFARDVGIVLTTTMPYSSQQAGRIERFNYTVGNGMRAALSGCGMPKRGWAEAAAWFAETWNRTHLVSEEHRTPYVTGRL